MREQLYWVGWLIWLLGKGEDMVLYACVMQMWMDGYMDTLLI